jgi:two-component system CheB/CheR fusion protein
LSLEAGPQLEGLLEYLREERGFDFTGYKRPSLIRRIAKRCQELGIDSFSAYLDYLQVHTGEFRILFDTILINVTEFFRDEAAWNYLKENVVPKLTARVGGIRVWSTGTASGEEAYSIAILLCEALGTDEFLRRVKIYATDVDDDALSKARAGYHEKELEQLHADLRKRYFESHGLRFQFKASLRRALIFGRSDLVQDAPISRLDLLLCRNVLIYFTAETQRRILTRFHYALKDDGFLFLGRSEMLLTHGSLFVPVDLRQRVFAKAAHLAARETTPAPAGAVETGNIAARRIRVRDLANDGIPYAQLVVDSFGVLVAANQAARRLFAIAATDIGKSLKDLELSYRPIDLRSPIDQVHRESRPYEVKGMELPVDGVNRVFDLYAAPLVDEEGTMLGVSVSFSDMTYAAQLNAELLRARQDVETAYEELQSSNEELETTNEELQSTVEELETTNEELQSSNEELETMNEELESTNSELESINTDVQMRNEEVARLNTLLLAVTGNIELGTAVLDGEMRVQVWNERAADMWGVRSDEVLGKSFFALDIGLPTAQLRQMIGSVGKGGAPHQELSVEAVTRRGRSIRCRVMAHFISNGERPAGAVLVMEELSGENATPG